MLNALVRCETSKTMIERLESLYMKKSAISLSFLQHKFYSYKIDESLSIGEHIGNIERLSNQMKSFGEQISASMLMSRILTTLPEKYKYFNSAWEATSNDQKTLNTLTTRLLAEEERFKNGVQSSKPKLITDDSNKTNNDVSRVFVASANGSERRIYSSNNSPRGRFSHGNYTRINSNYKRNQPNCKNRFNGKCYRCGMYGHTAKSCRNNVANSCISGNNGA